MEQAFLMLIGSESFFDGKQPFFSLWMKSPGVVLKEEVVQDDARLHCRSQGTGYREGVKNDATAMVQAFGKAN